MPGYTMVSDQIFTRDKYRPHDAKLTVDQPDIVILYGWGDGLREHVFKYADGYSRTFARAKQIVVLSPMAKTMLATLRQRSHQMTPIVHFIDNALRDNVHTRIIVHVMSNTGLVNYAATLNEYYEIHGKPLPHQLLVLDSTPGTTVTTLGNVTAWSRSMGSSTATWFPWPVAVTESIWTVILCVNVLFSWMTNDSGVVDRSSQLINNNMFETQEARKLYLYSKEDDLISWEDIELHAAETRERGWMAETEVFCGSMHVRHMQKFPEQYWNTIRRVWRSTLLRCNDVCHGTAKTSSRQRVSHL